VIAEAFPLCFHLVFFGGSLIIEKRSSFAGRFGAAGVPSSRPARALSGDFRNAVHFFGLIGWSVGILSTLMYVLLMPRIDFEKREWGGVPWQIAPDPPDPLRTVPCRYWLAAKGVSVAAEPASMDQFQTQPTSFLVH